MRFLRNKLLIMALFVTMLSGCPYTSTSNLHSNLENYPIQRFLGPGVHDFYPTSDCQNNDSFHFEISSYDGKVTSFSGRTDKRELEPQKIISVVRSPSFKVDRYVLVTKDKDTYYYSPFDFHSKNSFTFHNVPHDYKVTSTNELVEKVNGNKEAVMVAYSDVPCGGMLDDSRKDARQESELNHPDSSNWKDRLRVVDVAKWMERIDFQNQSPLRNITSHQSIGLITYEALTPCTGTLVHPRLVLTAAHCIYKNGQMKRGLMFVPGYDLNDENQVGYEFSKVWQGTKTPYKDPHEKDWAIAMLSRPLNIPVKRIMNARNTDIIGSVGKFYGYDEKFLRKYDKGSVIVDCRITGPYSDRWTSPNLVSHSCNTRGGTSGGPLVITRNGEEYIVGISVYGQPLPKGNLTITTDAFFGQLENIILKIEYYNYYKGR